MTGMSWTAEGDFPSGTAGGEAEPPPADQTLALAGEQAEGTAGPPRPGAGPPPAASELRWHARQPSVRSSIWVLEHAQDLVTVTVGAVLVVLAVVLMIAGIVDFASSKNSMETAGQDLLDQILLVLILLEIVHTVVLTLRAHRLVAQPFIVVGLIAVVRRILLVLNPESPTSKATSTSQLALLIGMVAVFVAALIAVSLFEKSDE
jgi:uncharacterized membrane protein (DUF373 family)